MTEASDQENEILIDA